MKKQEKRMIAILVAITVIVIIIAIVTRNRNNNGEEGENRIQQSSQQKETNTEEEEYVNVLEDGTRQNTSEKLKETKTIDGMEISDIQLTEKDNVTLLLGTITNTTNETRGGYPVNVQIVDEEGNEIITITGYIEELAAGESSQFSTSATFDYANAYDFNITKQ